MTRAERFTYVSLTADDTTLTARYRLDDVDFLERVDIEGADFGDAAQRAIAELWYLIAGLSYFKAGAPPLVDLGATPVGPAGRALLAAALYDGLGEFGYRNQLPLDDVTIVGGAAAEPASYAGAASRVLIPFGGGIDSCVTVESLAHLERSLFVLSPVGGRFTPLEATAAVTGLAIRRATRTLDIATLRSRPFLQGHVPVTTMVALLACLSALAHGDGAVAMSNEHSSSAPNLIWNDHAINHQWSKSARAETLIAAAVAERIGDDFVIASFLRDRSEIWVAREFTTHQAYLPVFRSCNRAFAQDAAERAPHWCGTCDKCLFINVMLAPFLPRATLRDVFQSEPLANPELVGALETLVGLGVTHKPFECVGDPDESAAALRAVAADPEWADVPALQALTHRLTPERDLAALLEPQGGSRVPAAWLR